MTNPELHDVLAVCISEALEQMFYVRAMDGAVQAAPESDSDLICGVDFAGDPSGRLGLRVSAEAARSMSADFLGEEYDNVSEGQVGQVVCELTNIVCGSILSRIESRTTFRLDSPRALSIWENSGKGAILHSVNLDNGVLSVLFATERPICPAAG